MKQAKLVSGQPDLRQRRTRKFLSEALLSLLEERPLSQISVVDICQRAMVHRTTFYSHFDDKQGLLRWTVADLMQEEFAKSTPALSQAADIKEYFLAVFHNALAFMQEHRGLYQVGIPSGETELLLLEDTVADELRRKLSDPAVICPAPDFDPELTAHFYAGAILALTRWWLETDTRVPEPVLLRHLERFIPLPDHPAQKG